MFIIEIHNLNVLWRANKRNPKFIKELFDFFGFQMSFLMAFKKSIKSRFEGGAKQIIKKFK